MIPGQGQEAVAYATVEIHRLAIQPCLRLVTRVPAMRSLQTLLHRQVEQEGETGRGAGRGE